MTAPSSRRLDAEVPTLESHLDFAAAQFADSEIARWHWPGELGGPRNRAQVESILRTDAAQERACGFTRWWWRERVGGSLVGMVGLNRAVIAGRPVVEIGWSIASASQRRGYCAEAAQAALSWGFEQCGLERVIAFTMRHNQASRAVMRRLGMGYERAFEREGLPHVLYSTSAP